jgi:NitT/TauT family transport system permease protein
MATATADRLSHEPLGVAGAGAGSDRPNVIARLWHAAWPKLLAVALFVGVWQAIVWSGWKSEAIIPSPFTVLHAILGDVGGSLESAAVTMRRAGIGFALAILIGGAVGVAVARVHVLRAAVGSMITGLQTMPSVAWVPLAIVLFQLSERAIMFVVILGAAPSIANGIIDGVDHVPPILLRAGRVLGARGFTALRHVVIPAALPSVVSGLKQGWAFAWRSLMAGELITHFPGTSGLGQKLSDAAANAEYVDVYRTMIVIFVIGVIVDALIFGTAVRAIRRRYGLVDAAG